MIKWICPQVPEMANIGEEDDQMDLPPGFRFHPTDEELIYQYLHKKVLGLNFSSRAIGEVELNKSEPWELPWKAKMGEKEWYFFCVRDRKYRSGSRTNRATNSGYWKPTGKDKEIYRGKSLVGMKKTLVFYEGRAPKGVKTNWIMHEYRLEGNFSVHHLPQTAKNELVICRVFQKSSDGKKTHISSLVKVSFLGNELGPAGLPPLMDFSPYINGKTNPVFAESPFVPCFSNPIDSQTNQQNTVDHTFNNHVLHVSSNCSHVFPQIPVSSSSYAANFQFSGSVSVQERSMLRALIENHGSNMKKLQGFKTERDIVSVSQEIGLPIDINPEISSVVSNLETGKKPFDDPEAPSSSAAPVDLDCLWHY